MGEISLERHVNELKGCTEEELLQILSFIDVEILVKAILNDIRQSHTLIDNMQSLFHK
ncbi:MAG: hypothetical protein IKW30_03835 [Lachnospiraceae bacterium]|nr:hypothetical protein [Lachnospiraceae bacterium]